MDKSNKILVTGAAGFIGFHLVNRLCKEGYDIIMHFCGNTNLYDFKKSKRGCYENILGPIYHYIDYELIPVNNKLETK